MTPWRAVLASAVWTLFVCPAAVLAQPVGGLPELSTDRPDFTESSEVVGRGVVQLEMGTTVEWDRTTERHDRAVTLPLALLRLGVSQRLEMRVSSDGFVVNTSDAIESGSISGQADLEVGAKILLRDGSNGGLALAVIPMVSLPIGADGISSDAVDPTIKFTWATTLPKGFGISGNVNLARLGDERGRYNEHGFSVSVGHRLVGDWDAYYEVFGFTPYGRPNANAWTIDTGISYPFGENAQIDFEIGRGITATAPDWFIGAGIGIRTPAFRR